MEIWDFLNPILRLIFYFASFGTLGTPLFIMHFKKISTSKLLCHCENIILKSALIGVLISLILFLSVAGNIGGDVTSVFDKSSLKLSMTSKAGIATIISLIGFLTVIISRNWHSNWKISVSIIGNILILQSFLMIGHSSRGGLITQLLLLIHLIGISYWLGALLPFRRLCTTSETGTLLVIAHRFGVFAIGYVLVLVLAGFGFTYEVLGGITPLIYTSYGNTLLVKISFVTLLLLLAALNKFRIVPLLKQNSHLAIKKLRISIHFEMVFASIVLILTSLLTTSFVLPIKDTQ